MSNFRIRTDRNGSRVFQGRQTNQHDDRDTHNYDRSDNQNRRGSGSSNRRSHGGRSRSGGWYNRSNKGVDPRSRLDDDIDMDGGSSRPRGRQRTDPYSRNRQHDRIGNRRLQMDREAEDRAVASYRLGLPVSRGSSSRWSRGSSNKRGGGGHGGHQDGWYKICIPHGKKLTKENLLDSLNQIVSVPFQPVSFHYEHESAVFYVQDQRAANALRECSRKISSPQGYKLVIISRQGEAPNDIPLTDEGVAKLKVVMSNRYDVAGRSLNLSTLHRDEELKKEGVNVYLPKRSIMGQVLGIIKEHIPELTILDLSDNRLSILDSLVKLHEHAPHLTHLNLGKNTIRTESELDHIKNVQLVELHLDGNKMCDRFTNETAYIRLLTACLGMRADIGWQLVLAGTLSVQNALEVPVGAGFHTISAQIPYIRLVLLLPRLNEVEKRSSSSLVRLDSRTFGEDYLYQQVTYLKRRNFTLKLVATQDSAIRQRFPKLMRLDGHDLPPPITFDVESVTAMPPTQGSYFLNEAAKDLVCRFLEQYFRIHDSDNRQPLFEAYHENAVFSLTAGYSKIVPGKQSSLSDYMHDSRNLIRVTDPVRRQRSLKVGRLNVVAYLSQLPNTQHDPTAFVVDITHASQTMMVFTVHGLFREPDSKCDTIPIRTFSRTFVTVPQGSGIVIINEELMLSNATSGQMQAAFRNPAPTPSSSPVQDAAQGVPAVEKQLEIGNRFSSDSGMNLEWSLKCLVENDWDYEKSARVFTDLQSKGSIPPEAFVK